MVVVVVVVGCWGEKERGRSVHTSRITKNSHAVLLNATAKKVFIRAPGLGIDTRDTIAVMVDRRLTREGVKCKLQLFANKKVNFC